MSVVFVFPAGKKKEVEIDVAGNVVSNSSPGVGKRWLILSGEMMLDTDANAANRYINIDVVDAAVVRNIGVSGVVIADKIAYVGFGEISVKDGSITLGPSAGDVNAYLGMVKPFLLEGADSFRVTITAGVAGDALTGSINVLEMDI